MSNYSNLPNIFLFNDTRSDRHHGCDAVMDAFFKMTKGIIKNIYTCPTTYSSVTSSRRPLWIQYPGIHELLSKSQLIVVNGEGSIHHSNRKARGLVSIASFAAKIGLPCILLNATLCQNDNFLLKQMQLFTTIYVRDTASKMILDKYNIDSIYAPDLTFYHYFDNSDFLDKNICYVSDSVLKEVRDYLDQYPYYDRGSIIHHEEVSNNYKKYIRKLSKYRFIITGRYHDVCFCINAKIPFIAIQSNTLKIGNLLHDVFGHCNRLIDPSQLANLKPCQFSQFENEEIIAIDTFRKKGQEMFLSMSNDIRTLSKVPPPDQLQRLIENEIKVLRQTGVLSQPLRSRCGKKIQRYINKIYKAFE